MTATDEAYKKLQWLVGQVLGDNQLKAWFKDDHSWQEKQAKLMDTTIMGPDDQLPEDAPGIFTKEQIESLAADARALTPDDLAKGMGYWLW